tara:strand:- start:35468 stop:36097 length:630 start_codon:yes stop_codon:yes gene_type:complete
MSFKLRLYSILGYFILKFIFWSNKKEIFGLDNLIKIKSEKRPVMICSWHGRLLFPVFNLNKLNFYALAGLHKDAEIISRICEKLGWKMIRGSSSKGGYKAYKGILNKLSSNSKIYITPDGPKGPIHIIKDGIVEASIKKEALILPISGISSKNWKIKNWDLFLIPKPFGKILNIYGDIIDTKTIKNSQDLKIKITQELNKIEKKTNDWF